MSKGLKPDEMPQVFKEQCAGGTAMGGPVVCRTASVTYIDAERGANGVRPSVPANEVRRRASLQQGQALELLGHAVEYLVDCRVFATDEQGARANQEAVQMLKRASREVFAECREVVPARLRLVGWLGGLRRVGSGVEV